MKLASREVLQETMETAGKISESATRRLSNGGNADDGIIQALADATIGRIGRILARMDQRGGGYIE